MQSKYKALFLSIIVLVFILSPAYLLLRNRSGVSAIPGTPTPIFSPHPSEEVQNGVNPENITPTCRPRPACLDETPRCLIAETDDMCPPKTKPTPPDYNGQKVNDGCIVSGCSSEICSDEEMFSTCILKPENECYKTAVCEKQTNGKCGWTETSDLKSCLEKY